MKNYTAEIIPFIPVSSWSYHEETHLTGHIHRNSPYECDDTCGTCDGAMCDYCERVTRREVTLDFTTEEKRELFKRAFPRDMEWDFVFPPKLPTIQDVYDVFPELYRAIISFLDCPDLIQEAENAKKAREEEARLRAEWQNKMKMIEESNKRRVDINSPLAVSGFYGTLIWDSDCFCHCRTDYDETAFIMKLSNDKDIKKLIPKKILELGLKSKYNEKDKIVEYNIPLGWLADCKIKDAYKAK